MEFVCGIELKVVLEEVREVVVREVVVHVEFLGVCCEGA
jgi:hypothetical protein